MDNDNVPFPSVAAHLLLNYATGTQDQKTQWAILGCGPVRLYKDNLAPLQLRALSLSAFPLSVRFRSRFGLSAAFVVDTLASPEIIFAPCSDPKSPYPCMEAIAFHDSKAGLLCAVDEPILGMPPRPALRYALNRLAQDWFKYAIRAGYLRARAARV